MHGLFADNHISLISKENVNTELAILLRIKAIIPIIYVRIFPGEDMVQHALISLDTKQPNPQPSYSLYILNSYIRIKSGL